MKNNLSQLSLCHVIIDRADQRMRALISRKIIQSNHPIAVYITIWKNGESAPCYKVNIGERFSSQEYRKECYDDSEIVLESLFEGRNANCNLVNTMQMHKSHDDSVAIIFEHNNINYSIAVSGLPCKKMNFILAVMAVAQNFSDLRTELMQRVIRASGCEEEFFQAWYKLA